MTTDGNPTTSEGKKKRGPKKKIWTPQIRKQRQEARRARANTRERQRMHGLNDSLETLRNACPLFANQRLSKIDTLRLARNYIQALSEILKNGEEPDALEYARTLTRDLSQGTTNLIAGHLQVSPHLLWYSENIFYPDAFQSHLQQNHPYLSNGTNVGYISAHGSLQYAPAPATNNASIFEPETTDLSEGHHVNRSSRTSTMYLTNADQCAHNSYIVSNHVQPTSFEWPQAVIFPK